MGKSRTLADLLSNGSTVVFNEGGADADFRVESVDYTNMLTVDGATNSLRIKNAVITDAVNVGGASKIKVGGSSYATRFGYFDDTGGVHGFHVDTLHSGTWTDRRFVVRADSGKVGIGTDSPDQRLTVNGKISLVGSAGTLERFETFDGSDAGLGVEVLGRYDIRDPEPYAHCVNGNARFGFTSYNLNNTLPYADSFMLTSYTDSSGGDPNMFLINKNGSGVKVARQGYASTSNFKHGTIYTLNYTTASDERVKENVQEITGGLESILALRPVTYEWTDEYILEGHSKNANENEYSQVEGEAPKLILPETKTTNVGFIAQEVEAVIPTVVHQDNIRLASMKEGDYLKNISYDKLVPHLVSAIKEQQSLIEALEARIEALENA